MAKKTSRNAVKKIDSQIDMIDADSKKKNNDDSVTLGKTELKKSVSRSSSTKKSTTSRSSKTTKKSPVKKSSKTSGKSTVKPSIKKEENVRDNIVVTPTKNTVKKETATKSVRGEVVVAPEKKSKTTTVKKTPAKKNVRGEVVIAPTKKRRTTKRIVNEVDPKQLDENVQNIIKDIEKQESKTKEEEKVVNPVDSDINKVVVEEPKKVEVSYDDWKLDKPIDLDSIDKFEDKSIIDEFEADIFKMRNAASKKSKKKNKYIINYHEKKVSSYSELEKDLRSLYDKVNDVVKDFSDYKKPYKSKSAKDNLEVEEDTFDNSPSLLDFVNQKVLNVFLILLSIIFIAMCVAFVWFIIFVSTF